MTDDEDTQWARYHSQLFADFRAWWDGLAKPTRDLLSVEFRRILRDTRLDHAMEVSRRMLSCQITPSRLYEQQLVPGRVAHEARKVAAEEAAQKTEPRDSEETLARLRIRTTTPGSPAGEILREIQRRVAAGEDRRAVAAELIPKPAENVTGKSYHCHRCLDTGLVTVWHTISVAAALQQALTPDRSRTMMVACSCSAADSRCLPDYAARPQGWSGWRQSARYAPESYCRCPGGDVSDPDRIAELLEWVADYATKRRSVPEHMRVSEFDQFNNR